MSLVRDDAPAWMLSMGHPARPIQRRSRGMIRVAAELEAARRAGAERCA
jgi:hypothetical protein